jgi:hypothetical protein
MMEYIIKNDNIIKPKTINFRYKLLLAESKFAWRLTFSNNYYY